MKLVKEIKIAPENNNKNFLLLEVAKKCKLNPADIKKIEIVKQGIDARKKPNVFYVYNVAIDVVEKKKKFLNKYEDVVIDKTGLDYKNIYNQKINCKTSKDNGILKFKCKSCGHPHRFRKR